MQETRASRVCALASRGLQFRRSPLGNQCKDRLPLSRNFHISTHVNCTRLNEIEAVYGRSRVNVKVERGQLLHLRVTFHTLSLFYSRAWNLRAYLRERYATMEIYPKSSLTKHAFATRLVAVFPCSWSTEMHADKNCLVSLGKEKTVFSFSLHGINRWWKLLIVHDKTNHPT